MNYLTESYHEKPSTNNALITPTTSFCDLQKVIQQYQSQPELLKLILTSKVEEDKRKAEEAKLRAKELDIYLKRCNSSTDTTSSVCLATDKKESQLQPPSIQEKREPDTPLLLPSLSKRKSDEFSFHCCSSPNKKKHVSPSSTSHTQQQSCNNYPRSSSISSHSTSSCSSVSSLNGFEDSDNVDYQQRRQSAAAAMLAMGGAVIDQQELAVTKKSQDISSAYPSPIAEEYTDERKKGSETNENENKPRRRREMQAISKIVETREFPYVDAYFWKNNGNTVQKKTGCKSIYYKCSNSNKGCSVNKTVTARSKGEYLIKYRGCHLSECGRVERVHDL